jgi:hypothetical protein
LQTVACTSEWFTGYPFLNFEITRAKELWRQDDVMNWFLMYGLERFAGLDIWDTQWPFSEYVSSDSCFLDTFVFKQKEDGWIIEIGDRVTNQYNPALFFYEQKNWNKVTDFSADTIDLLVVHDSNLLKTYIDEFAHAHVIAFPIDKITEDVMQKLCEYDFSLVPYDDNGYSYFLKMRMVFSGRVV